MMWTIAMWALLMASGLLGIPAAAEKLPMPKEGLLVRKADGDRIQRRLNELRDEPALVGKKGQRLHLCFLGYDQSLEQEDDFREPPDY